MPCCDERSKCAREAWPRDTAKALKIGARTTEKRQTHLTPRHGARKPRYVVCFATARPCCGQVLVFAIRVVQQAFRGGSRSRPEADCRQQLFGGWR
eukprot:1093384-Prymnesium_polylepis.3